MISPAKKEKYNILAKIISKDILQNVYLYIDTQMYGYNEENVKTFILEENNDIKVILYHYYNSLQLFQCSKLSDDNIKEISNHILEYKFNMISGNSEITLKIQKELKELYHITHGCIMSKKDKILEFSEKTEFAQPKDCMEIAELICSDQSIGGHYEINGFKEQLIDRMTTKNCVNLILRDKKIISHAATYADCNSIAVIGGVITDKNYRGMGYGKMLVNDLTKHIQDNNKTPVLYCYDEKTIKWYESLGWEKSTQCAKLELK